MSATIVNRFSTNRFNLTTAAFARPISITNWTRIRIGAMIQVNAVATIPAGFQMAIGLCSGTTNILGDATTDHFVGANSGASAWTFSGGYLQSGAWSTYKRVGTTVTTGSNVSTNMVSRADPATTDSFGMYAIEIQKGSPNFTFRLFNKATISPTNITEAQFLATMEAPWSACSLTLHNYGAGASTLAVDEGTDGTLNAFNFYWSPAGNFIDIREIAVAILQP